MSLDLKSELRIPDLWYDVYARFLPGAAFIGAIRVYFFDDLRLPSAMEFVVLVTLGYLAALVTQPVSSILIGWIERWVERLQGEEAFYVRKMQRRLGRDTGEAKVLGKMHGEVSFFIQLALLAIVTFGATFRYPVVAGVRSGSLAIGLVAAILGFLTAKRRLKRAVDDADIEQAFNNGSADGSPGKQ